MSSCFAFISSLFSFQGTFFTKNITFSVVGSNGLEPSTSRLSGVRSNHLSYEPIYKIKQTQTEFTVETCQSLSLLEFLCVGRTCCSLTLTVLRLYRLLLRKEVIQPHLPIRLPCYDFTPITRPTFGSCLFTVSSLTSGISDSHGVTGGVYKARERIHGSMLTCHY